MNKVRIGNDIRLRVNLLGNKNTDYINIKSIRAYIVNVSRQQDLDNQHRIDSVSYADSIEDRRRVVKYISRFPAEPHSHAYHGTPYDLCHSGHPTFHVRPVYCVAPYIGFGVHPHTFDPFDNHLWGYDDMMDLHNDMLRKDEDYKLLYANCEFSAPVVATAENNKVDVYFPAESQIYTGTYKLIIIAKLYEPGYGKNNLRTVTMDYNEIFTLVGSSEEGATGDITLTIGNAVQASGIRIDGTLAIATGQIGRLIATVYPTDIDDNSVEWSIVDGQQHVAILSVEGNSCKVIGLTNGTATIKATSVKTNSVYKEATITVADEIPVDIYTLEGNLNDNNINLRLTDGNTVAVDVSRETAWYEGD